MRAPAQLIGLLCAAVAVATLGVAPAAQAAGPPQVKAVWVTEVTSSGANLRAEVIPNGFATTYRFEYLSEAAYEANLKAIPPKDSFSGASKAPFGSEAPIGSGESIVSVVQHIGALKAATAYRYRLVATNAAGPLTVPAHSLRTDENTSVFSLPDDRGWELVSPVEKNGGEIAVPGALFDGGVLQAAATGAGATYGSRTSFANAQGAPGASQYISRRTSSGWATENITLPALSGSYGDKPDGVPYQLFSGDLARALLLDGRRCEAGSPCPRSYSLRDNSTAALSQSAQEADLRFAGASADLGHVVLSTCAALTPSATEAPGSEGCDPAFPNLYRWNGSTLTLINLLPGETSGSPGATLAAQSAAISGDGFRTYFVHGGSLYLRDGGQTVQVDEAVGGGGVFETASTDGSVAFFSKGEHLYRYDVASKAATDLTPAGELLGVLGASEDASRLYYATAAGLFLRHGATTTPIASEANASNYPAATGTARVSSDGTLLAFLSSAELVPYDNNGKSEVYLYQAAGNGTLTCISCNPSGERPLGPASIPGATANGKGPAATNVYKPRALSATGTRLFFDSSDPLVTHDTNGDRDVYQWEAQGTGSCARAGGCVALISDGTSAGGAVFFDASADGSDAFFLTAGSLVLQDPGSVDLYDARVGGGFAAVPAPLPCLGDACQALPPEPEDPRPGTLFQSPSGNQPLVFPKEKGKGKKGKGTKHKKRHSHKKKHGKRAGRR